MIVIGVDVHKQSVTAVAVDEAGRTLDERTSRSAATSCSAGRGARRGAAVGGRGLPAADALARAAAARASARSWCGCRRS